jgi:hypothetical protein
MYIMAKSMSKMVSKAVSGVTDSKLLLTLVSLGAGLLVGYFVLCQSCVACGPPTVLTPTKLETKVVETTKQTYTTDNLVADVSA